MDSDKPLEFLYQIFARFLISGLVFYLFVIWLSCILYLRLDNQKFANEPVFILLFSVIMGLLMDMSKFYKISWIITGDKKEFVSKIQRALYASKICSYAQGYQLMREASAEHNWDLKFGDIALMWREGCIIRAQFLGRIKEAFDKNPDLQNLLLDDYFKKVIEENQSAWREVVSTAVKNGIPVPAFSSALAYYDGYRSPVLPANLLQAQRDYFGAHTYERVDKPRGEFFHTNWTGRGGTTASTTYTV